MLPLKRIKTSKLKKPIAGNAAKKKKHSLELKQQEYRSQHGKHNLLSQNGGSTSLKYKTNHRITVKRGIFPHAIRTDVVKKQNFQIRAPKLDLRNLGTNNAGMSKNFFSRKHYKAIQADEHSSDNGNDVPVSHRNLTHSDFDQTTPFQRRKITPVPENSYLDSMYDSTGIFTKTLANKNSTEADNNIYLDTETENIKVKEFTLKQHISRIQWYEKEEAQSHLLYKEEAEVINRTFIIERVTYFSDCSDAMQEIQQKLWKLRDSRDEELSQSRRTSERTATYIQAEADHAVLPNVELEKTVDSPMMIDHGDSFKYFTPFNHVSENSNPYLTPVGQNRELFLNIQDPVRFKFCPPSACKNSHDRPPRKEDVVLRTRKTMERSATKKNAPCFPVPKNNLLDVFPPVNYQMTMLPKMPVVPDTIDQNSAFGPLEYLDYVTKKRGSNTKMMYPDELFKSKIQKPPTKFSRYSYDQQDGSVQLSFIPRQKYSGLEEVRGWHHSNLNLGPNEFFFPDVSEVANRDVSKNYSSDLTHQSNPFALHQPSLFEYENMVPMKDNHNSNDYLHPRLTNAKSPKLLYSARYVH